MNEEVKKYIEPGRKNLILIYILFLTGIFAPLAQVIGAVFAYANLNEGDIRWRSHYIFAFRTFLIGVVGFCISVVAGLIFLGTLVRTIVLIWFAVRVIVGIRLVNQGLPHQNPKTFWV